MVLRIVQDGVEDKAWMVYEISEEYMAISTRTLLMHIRISLEHNFRWKIFERIIATYQI